MSSGTVMKENFYNENSLYQKTLNFGVTPQLIAAAAAVSSQLPATSHVVISDLGCSQGANSQQPVSNLIQELRRNSSSSAVAVSIYHVDQPSNDFNSLFKVLESTDTSYLRQHPHNVFVYAQGKSFYEQLSAPGSVHISFCLNSIHWLSRKPKLTCASLFPRCDAVLEEDSRGNLS